MPALKIDANLAFHPKALEVGNAAMGLWVRAGAWCVQYDTDGAIPSAVVLTLGTQAQAYALEQAGLLERTSDAGYTMLLWDDGNVGTGESLAGPI